MRTRVKICGITRARDGRAAAALGADAIGLNFYHASPRAVTVAQARAIVDVLPPFVTVVGLFVDETPHGVRRVLDAVRLDLLQFHGREEPAECERYDRPYIKSVPMRAGVSVAAQVRTYGSAAGLLLDTWQRDKPGGSGMAFDWSLVPLELDVPVILAGGLTPRNVSDAIRQVSPFAVDVSGGVESAKGIKDENKMADFIREVQSVATSR